MQLEKMRNGCSDCPLVSIIMPAYNCERYVEPAIRSVMAQTYSNWELIVIDDGSLDATPDIITRLSQEDSRIHFCSNETNMGVAKTRNRGLDLCRGDYVALLDSDDLWNEDKLQLQLNLISSEGADVCYTSYKIVDVAGRSIRKDYLVPEQVDYDELLKENVIGCSTVLLSRHAVNGHRFSTGFYHEDYVLWLDLLQQGYRAVGCATPLVKWRYRTDSRSFDKRRSIKYRWRIYRKHLHLSFGKSLQLVCVYMGRGIKKYI